MTITQTSCHKPRATPGTPPGRLAMYLKSDGGLVGRNENNGVITTVTTGTTAAVSDIVMT